MSEEIKNEEVNNEEVNIDEKLNELLNDPSIKTEEEKKFIQEVGEALKKGEVPIDLIMNKANEASSKFDNFKNTSPEFELLGKSIQNKINTEIEKMLEELKNLSVGK
jgi:hypothetical protein